MIDKIIGSVLVLLIIVFNTIYLSHLKRLGSKSNKFDRFVSYLVYPIILIAFIYIIIY